jgi:hypothetical protein
MILDISYLLTSSVGIPISRYTSSINLTSSSSSNNNNNDKIVWSSISKQVAIISSMLPLYEVSEFKINETIYLSRPINIISNDTNGDNKSNIIFIVLFFSLSNIINKEKITIPIDDYNGNIKTIDIISLLKMVTFILSKFIYNNINSN